MKKEKQIRLDMLIPAYLKLELSAQARRYNMNLSEYIRAILDEVNYTFQLSEDMPEGIHITPKPAKTTLAEDVI